MKILQLVQKPQRRGAEVFAYQLTGHLRIQNHEVRIAYLYPYDGAAALPVEDPDFQLHGKENSSWERMPGFHPLLLKRVRSVISKFKPDIVQVNGARTVKYGAFAKYGAGNNKWILIYRNIGNPADWVTGWHRRSFYEYCVMPKIDGIVGVSKTTLQNLLHFYELSTPSISIPRGVDIQVAQIERSLVRQRTNTPDSAPVVVYVGSLTREKRPDRFLRIIAKLQTTIPEIRAWIVGDGPMQMELQQQSQANGLQGIVQFMGAQTDVNSLMAAADLLLLTSDTEGIPGVILEAAVQGIPAVASLVGGVSESILDRQTGILVNAQDEEGFVQSAAQLIADSTLRRTMGRYASEWVSENFNMTQITQRYIEFYNQVLSEKK